MREVIMAEELARIELLEKIKAANNPPLTDQEEDELRYLKNKVDCIRRGVRY